MQSSLLCAVYKPMPVWPQQRVLQPVLPPDSCMTCMSRDLCNSTFTGEFSFSLHVTVPVCREAWSRRGARSPLFSFACCCAHFLATYQLQTVTCYRVLVLLSLARQKEKLGMQRISEVLGFPLILEGEMQTVG